MKPQIMVPWIPYVATTFLDGYLKEGHSVFEWGSGGSTRYFIAKKCKVVSVEHDPSYLLNADCDILLIPPVGDKVLDGNIWNPATYRSSCIPGSFEDYASSIDDYGEFDLVLVDGRARPSCIYHAIKHVKKNGVLLLDNSDREWYLRDTKQLLEDWDVITFYGHGPYLDYRWNASCWINYSEEMLHA